MPNDRNLRYSDPLARLQFTLLMVLFRLVKLMGWRAGYGVFARGLGRLFGARRAVWLTVPGGAPYKIYLNDGYWTRFGLFHTHYEPEVAVIMHAARGHTPLFCDLGANGGYWTVRAAGHFDAVIAVEASAQTFDRLKENAGKLPGVTLHHAAIDDRSGRTLTFLNTHNSHASARLLRDDKPSAADRTESVKTLTIDDLVPPGTPALIKLDVEGAEIAALTGAARAIADGAVLIYEDHGGDISCAPSANLLSNPDMRLFALEDGFTEVKDLDQIRAIKSDRYKGYNFVAAHHASSLLAALRQALQSHERTDTTGPTL
ncbi:FkbM family methyltransferase [Roseovarius pelagicus]|uniref:FkbM family methyltransferase n=1 Tax=Roseovarius pelagicus TaxID=2980108 RepID=A0ABY6D8B2_9RHOB|nr:FkbM family methyltransferase [Roseovarius pelagicus]UXX81855.1 FkbM family methyltransferase [Roseovarius pelagicus]